MKLRKIYVILLTLICLMGFGLSFNKIEAAAGTITLTCKDSGKSSDGSSAITSSNAIFNEYTLVDNTENTQYVYLGKDGYGVKLGSGSKKGILSFTLKQQYFIKSVTVYTKVFDSGKNFKITIGNSTSSNISITDGANTYTPSSAVQTNLIKISAENSSSNRFYITKIEIETIEKTKLNAITDYSYDNNSKTLSWSAVENVDKYAINLVDENNNTYSYTSNTNSLVLSDIPFSLFEGTIVAKASATSSYSDSDPLSIIFENKKKEITAEILSSITLLKQIALTCNTLESSSITVNLENYWTNNNLSTTENDTTYKNEVSFVGEGLKLTSVKDGIRPWYNDGYQIRLYKAGESFTFTSDKIIEEISLVGGSTNITVTTPNYSYSNEKISGNGSKSVSFTISSTTTITKISVAYGNESAVKYKDFSCIKLRFMTDFVQNDYDVLESGYIVSTLSNIETLYSNALPTETNGENKIFIRPNTTGKENFVMDVVFDTVEKCKDSVYVYYYVKYTSESGEKILYKNFGDYSVISVLNQYSNMTELDSTLKDVVNALLAELNKNQ